MPLDARVLYVDHTAQLGGAELSLLDLAAKTPQCCVALFEDGPFATRLKDAGVEVALISAPSLKAVRRESTLLSGFSAVRGIMQSVRGVARLGRDFDVLYANSQKGWVATALASKLCRKPAVWHLRDMLTEDHFSKTNIRVVIALANRFATAVIANSNATRQAFIDAGGREDLVRVIYNGIDPTPFGTVEQKLSRHEGEIPVVACVGRLCSWKGQHVFLDAIAMTPDVRGWVIGAALFGEDDYAQELKDRAESLGIADRVDFLGFRKDIPDLLSRCDILAHTATSPEPFGRVIAEAMFARAAVVATRGGGPSEIIDDGRTGLLVPPNDHAALASAIKQLVSDPANMQKQVAAAHIDACQRFALDTVVRQVHEQLIEITRNSIPLSNKPKTTTGASPGS
jgi:glycosyltransferase involved in cell wall biosynthesis